MKYIWIEDTGAGFHFWEFSNEHLFQGEFVVESKWTSTGKNSEKTRCGIHMGTNGVSILARLFADLEISRIMETILSD